MSSSAPCPQRTYSSCNVNVKLQFVLGLYSKSRHNINELPTFLSRVLSDPLLSFLNLLITDFVSGNYRGLLPTVLWVGHDTDTDAQLTVGDTVTHV